MRVCGVGGGLCIFHNIFAIPNSLTIQHTNFIDISIDIRAYSLDTFGFDYIWTEQHRQQQNSHGKQNQNDKGIWGGY